MVKHSIDLDAIFSSLADPTRRDIVRRVSRRELSVREIARAYEKHMSLAAVSKHLAVLERARLVRKRRAGQRQLVSLSPSSLKAAAGHLDWYRALWENKLDRLQAYVEK